MSAKGNLERFVEKAPLAVMTRCIVGEVINERFEEVFETSHGRNYNHNIPFSVLAKAVIREQRCFNFSWRSWHTIVAKP